MSQQISGQAPAYPGLAVSLPMYSLTDCVVQIQTLYDIVSIMNRCRANHTHSTRRQAHKSCSSRVRREEQQSVALVANNYERHQAAIICAFNWAHFCKTHNAAVVQQTGNQAVQVFGIRCVVQGTPKSPLNGN